MRIRITREVDIPDQYKLELYKRAPELGPRILFFSGGTALRRISRELIQYTHNSIHLITPFDSGGSSAVLREAFSMPAIGDIRNRLMALADQSIKGNPEIFDLFAYRLSHDTAQEILLEELRHMADGEHPLVQRIPDPMRKIIRSHLHQFLDIMPQNFNLHGASLGNIVLTAGYMTNRRQLDPVIFIFSRLVRVCGQVRPTINKDLHLAVRLRNGTTTVGQHKITGKEESPINAPIDDMWLTNSLHSAEPAQAHIRNKIVERIAKADLICYPIGSFYSSIIANLLPYGVGEAIVNNPSPKVFIPNTTEDPEAPQLSVAQQVEQLFKYLERSGAPSGNQALECVIIDSMNASYPGGIERDKLKQLGVKIIDTPLISKQSSPLIDEKYASAVLLSLT